MIELLQTVGGPLSLAVVSIVLVLGLACLAPRWKIRLHLAWYDLWLGAYWDRKHRTLYLMLPLVGVKLELK